MKKVLTLALCFMMVVSTFAFTAQAAESATKLPVYKYATLLDGTYVNGEVKVGTDGLHKATDKYNGQYWYFDGEMDEMSFDKGYLTVTPNSTDESADFCIDLGKTIDISGFEDAGYIKIVMKTKIKPNYIWGGLVKGKQTTSMRSWHQWQDGGFSKGAFMNGLDHGEKLVTFSNWQVETNEKENWYTLLVPIKDCANPNKLGTPAAFDKLYLRTMYMEPNTSRAPLDVKEISLWGADRRADMRIISTKMNSDAKYEVNLEFSTPIDTDTFDGAVFTINDIEAENQVYDYDEDVVTLVFDMSPVFPSELTLNVEGLNGDNGLPTKPSVVVNNSEAVDYASLEIKKLDYKTTGVSLETEVTCVYDKTGEGNAPVAQEMSVLLVIYEDNVLKAYKISDATTLLAKASDDITIDILAEDIADYDETEEYKAEIYVIDNETNEKPLAKVQVVE